MIKLAPDSRSPDVIPVLTYAVRLNNEEALTITHGDWNRICEFVKKHWIGNDSMAILLLERMYEFIATDRDLRIHRTEAAGRCRLSGVLY